MTQSSRKSIISRPGDDGMAARVPSGKGKGIWFCVSVRVQVCVRAHNTCLSLLYLHNSSYFAAHFCSDCSGTEGGGGRRAQIVGMYDNGVSTQSQSLQ